MYPRHDYDDQMSTAQTRAEFNEYKRLTGLEIHRWRERLKIARDRVTELEAQIAV